MSGIRVGSRLDQLRELERQVKVAIELEERTSGAPRRVLPETTPAPRQGSSPAAPGPACVVVPVRSVRVDVIRDWATTHGYAMTERGRIPHLILEEFAAAHR